MKVRADISLHCWEEGKKHFSRAIPKGDTKGADKSTDILNVYRGNADY